jgi:hypothetical protein
MSAPRRPWHQQGICPCCEGPDDEAVEYARTQAEEQAWWHEVIDEPEPRDDEYWDDVIVDP